MELSDYFVKNVNFLSFRIIYRYTLLCGWNKNTSDPEYSNIKI